VTPLLIVGDAPSLPTGLGRICRDLAGILYAQRAALDIDLAVLGLGWDGSRAPYHIYPLRDEANWGEADFSAVWQDLARGRPGIVFSIWDPARCYPLAQWKQAMAREGRLPPKLWGYFAIDAENPRGAIGGPAGAALAAYDQVLAYGEWGSRVLRRTLERERVPWLPHGYSPLHFFPRGLDVGDERKLLVGAVAANQARKDLGALFTVWSILAEEDEHLYFWLHTDADVKYWSIPELIEVSNLPERVLVTGLDLSDAALRRLYSQCYCTIAPGLGEGFGYPIIESLACGVPVVGVDYAGGAEWTPAPWRSPPAAWRLEGTYALRRPVLSVSDIVRRVQRAMAWVKEEPEVSAAYCRGAVAHLQWGNLAPRWHAWFSRVLKMTREEWRVAGVVGAGTGVAGGVAAPAVEVGNG
jgi:glycosyltransferase involved in cell wall biosynthesis